MSTPKTTPRDALAAVGRDLDRLSTAFRGTAESHALAALDGDEKEARLAKENKGKSEAYAHACQIVDAVRQRIEAGEVG